MYTCLELNFKDQYIIISGMACELSFQDVLDSSMLRELLQAGLSTTTLDQVACCKQSAVVLDQVNTKTGSVRIVFAVD
jgi:hypothetical protein